MGEVKKYRVWLPDGYGAGKWAEVVELNDYATLEAENAKLRAELERRAVPDGWRELLQEVAEYAPPYGTIVAMTSQMALGSKARRMLAAAPSAPKADEQRPLYTCIGKGGEYRYLGTAIGAGDSRGELVEVYQDENGQLYHRTPEDFMERMEPIAAARKGEGK